MMLIDDRLFAFSPLLLSLFHCYDITPIYCSMMLLDADVSPKI